MAFTEQDAQADIASYQPPADKTAEPHPMATPAGTPPDPIAAAQTPPPAQVTPSYLDGVLSFVDKYRSRVSEALDMAEGVLPTLRPTRDLASGAIKGGVELADSAKSLLTAGPAVSETFDENGSLTATEDKAPAPDPFHPVYDAARGAVLAMRDAIAVKDPSIADNLIQGFGQFVGPFAMYSRVLGSFGTAAELAGGSEAALTSFGSKVATAAGKVGKFAATDAATNATANAPHDPRIADLLSLHNTAEGKFHDILNAVSPDGSLVRHYLDYIASPDVSEADGRFKNVLDGFNIATALTGALHVGAGTLRAGWGALNHMADNNMGAMGDLMPANQEGKIGWHGTPHNPDFFDNEKIGTGEGAQIYGHGHYIAENQATGQHYADTLSKNGTASAPLKLARMTVAGTGGNSREALIKLNAMADSAEHPNDKAHYQAAARLVKSGNASAGSGNLLKVDIADSHVDNMLDWDKPLSEQPNVVKNLQKIGAYDPTNPEHMLMKGKDVQKNLTQLGFTPKTIANMMNEAGIPGIKYLDAGSRNGNPGTSNYVVFDGKNIKIVGKNGKPVEK